MSNPISSDDLRPALNLEFFQAGRFRRKVRGWVHDKTTPYTIFVHTVAGDYDIRQGRRRFSVPTGRVLVVPAHTPTAFIHHDGPEGEFEARWIHLHVGTFGPTDFLARYDLPDVLDPDESAEVARLIDRALEADQLPGDDPLRWIRQQRISAELLERICQSRRPREQTHDAAHLAEQLQPVLLHIRENLATPLRAEHLARLAGMSPARLFSSFKTAFGHPPMQYVRNIRLEVAARLLAGTGHTLAQVAELVGFADAFHLSHAFKARFGTAPREYRRRANTV